MSGRTLSEAGCRTLERLARCPHPIPDDWLASDRHPRVFCTPEELARTRDLAGTGGWRGQFVQDAIGLCDDFLAAVPDGPGTVVPPPGSQFVYGLGMNLDPVHGRRMTWCGWNDPFRVQDCEERPYPNEDWPDEGEGAICPETGERIYFVAQANAHIVRELEQRVLPALCDVAVLTESSHHARVAAALLDEIAAVYPTNRRGPLDYPTSEGDLDRGGRLDRPYYQTARGLQNYITCIDLLASTGVLERPSIAAHGTTIREHLIRNLLWDGGWYCLDYTYRGFQLHNGHADYMRGAALVGLLLGRRDFAAPLLSGPLGFESMLDINLDRNGLYHEVSHGYASHTRRLYILLAEILHYAGQAGWDHLPQAYNHPAFAAFLRSPFDTLALCGHVPVIGDAGPDRKTVNPGSWRTLTGENTSDPLLREQIETTWTRLVRAADAAQQTDAAALLHASAPVDGVAVPPATRWAVYHIRPRHEQLVRNDSDTPPRITTCSAVLGQKGLALLRQGREGQEVGCQLFFGPVHNHGQHEALTWLFYADGVEWSFDPGYFNTHYRFGWTSTTVAHQAVTVNQQNVDTACGAGHLLAWKGNGAVQYAVANHPGAYAGIEPSGPYHRLIAQVVDPSSGALAYWLDISRVGIGTQRDDSFHTQMQRVSFTGIDPETDTDRQSLYGEVNLGDRVRDDLRLSGPDVEDKPFYWRPDGDGYGFLGHPRQAAMETSVRLVFSQPAFARDRQDRTLVAWLDAAPGRMLVAADSPMAPGAPRVPYILRRDTDTDPSVFAKLVHLTGEQETPAVQSLHRLEPRCRGLDARRAGAGAWRIDWSDGHCDVWLLPPAASQAPWHVDIPGLSRLQTDGLLAFARFADNGELLQCWAESATTLSLGDEPPCTGRRHLTGTLTQLSVAHGQTHMSIDWDKMPQDPPDVCGIATVISPMGQPRTWSLTSLSADGARFADLKASLGNTPFRPLAGAAGWYGLAAGISRFFSAGSRPLTAYALGRGVMAEGRLLGRIVDLTESADAVRIQPESGCRLPEVEFQGTVLDATPGDRIRVPLRLVLAAP